MPIEIAGKTLVLVFGLDETTRHHEFPTYRTHIANLRVVLYDWRKYAEIRHNDRRTRSMSRVALNPVFWTKPQILPTSQQWTELGKYFDLDRSSFDYYWIHDVLLRYPPKKTDRPGQVYFLERLIDVHEFRTGKIRGVLLHKIGKTQGPIVDRLKVFERKNGEQYWVLGHLPTAFHDYLEYCLHRYF